MKAQREKEETDDGSCGCSDCAAVGLVWLFGFCLHGGGKGGSCSSSFVSLSSCLSFLAFTSLAGSYSIRQWTCVLRWKDEEGESRSRGTERKREQLIDRVVRWCSGVVSKRGSPVSLHSCLHRVYGGWRDGCPTCFSHSFIRASLFSSLLFSVRPFVHRFHAFFELIAVQCFLIHARSSFV